MIFFVFARFAQRPDGAAYAYEAERRYAGVRGVVPGSAAAGAVAYTTAARRFTSMFRGSGALHVILLVPDFYAVAACRSRAA